MRVWQFYGACGIRSDAAMPVAQISGPAHLLISMDNSAAGLRTAAQWATQRTRGLGYGIREIYRSREGVSAIGADDGAAARPPAADAGAPVEGAAGGQRGAVRQSHSRRRGRPEGGIASGRCRARPAPE